MEATTQPLPLLAVWLIGTYAGHSGCQAFTQISSLCQLLELVLLRINGKNNDITTCMFRLLLVLLIKCLMDYNNYTDCFEGGRVRGLSKGSGGGRDGGSVRSI